MGPFHKYLFTINILSIVLNSQNTFHIFKKCILVYWNNMLLKFDYINIIKKMFTKRKYRNSITEGLFTKNLNYSTKKQPYFLWKIDIYRYTFFKEYTSLHFYSTDIKKTYSSWNIEKHFYGIILRILRFDTVEKSKIFNEEERIKV